MEKLLLILLVFSFGCGPSLVETSQSRVQRTAQTRESPTKFLHIYPNMVAVPLGRIILIRKDSDYCAVKFTDFSMTGEKYHESTCSRYESYYQGDKSGDFTRKNVKVRKGLVSDKDPIIWRFRGGDPNIRCGPIKRGWVGWPGMSSVYFKEFRGGYVDYELEMTPTRWVDISEVNVFDSRLKWYKYDERRKPIKINIEKLWEDTQEKK
jgi:hypothetical protein